MCNFFPSTHHNLVIFPLSSPSFRLVKIAWSLCLLTVRLNITSLERTLSACVMKCDAVMGVFFSLARDGHVPTEPFRELMMAVCICCFCFFTVADPHSFACGLPFRLVDNTFELGGYFHEYLCRYSVRSGQSRGRTEKGGRCCPRHGIDNVFM